MLKKLNIVNKKSAKLKILGSGEIKDKITIEANFFSKSAKDKLEKIKFFNLGKENNYKNLLNANLITQMNKLYKNKLLKFNYEL